MWWRLKYWACMYFNKKKENWKLSIYIVCVFISVTFQSPYANMSSKCMISRVIVFNAYVWNITTICKVASINLHRFRLISFCCCMITGQVKSRFECLWMECLLDFGLISSSMYILGKGLYLPIKYLFSTMILHLLSSGKQFCNLTSALSNFKCNSHCVTS